MKQREISVTIRRAKKDDMTQVYKMIRVSLQGVLRYVIYALYFHCFYTVQ